MNEPIRYTPQENFEHFNEFKLFFNRNFTRAWLRLLLPAVFLAIYIFLRPSAEQRQAIEYTVSYYFILPLGLAGLAYIILIPYIRWEKVVAWCTLIEFVEDGFTLEALTGNSMHDKHENVPYSDIKKIIIHHTGTIGIIYRGGFLGRNKKTFLYASKKDDLKDIRELLKIKRNDLI
ncbi:MAG: hypothetical protein KAQ98_00975 [Bacteriovoracaceae bacterium]|nr:hypothetical protein [Bacteriovoracaceae bacterium]